MSEQDNQKLRIVAPGKSPMANTDYTAFLGQNIQEPGERDPFAGEVPKDAKGYAAYRAYYEKRIGDVMQGQGILKLSTTCETQDAKGNRVILHTPKKGHFGSSVIFACDHVLHLDPQNPDALYLVPLHRGTGGYWLCGTCFGLLNKYKLDLNAALKLKCASCFLPVLQKMEAEHPDRLHDLSRT